jgi:hypothetical protein
MSFEGTGVTQEQLESWLEANGEEFTYAGFVKNKNAHMYLRDDGCPWRGLHTSDNKDETDFAVFVGNGPLAAKCMHESCKAGWTADSCWTSYRAKLTGDNGYKPMQSYVAHSSSGYTKTFTPESEASEPPSPIIKPSLALTEAALDGRLGEICHEHFSTFALDFAWPALLTVASVFYPHPNDPSVITSSTNLFTTVVGPTHSGKSTVIEYAQHVLGLQNGDPRLAVVKFGSAELLLKHIADRQCSTILWSPDELRHVMDKASIQHSSFATILCSLFSQHRGMVSTSGGKDYPIRHQVSLLAGTAVDEFGDSFGVLTLGGLYDRFLIGLFPTGYPEHDYVTDWHLVHKPAMVVPIKVSVHPSVDERANAWKKAHPGSARCVEIVTRIARICASISGKPILHADDMGPALALAEYQYEVRKVLKPNTGDNPIAKCASKVKAALFRTYPAWMLKRELERAAHKNRIGPHLWEMTLRYMKTDDLQIRTIGGKPEYRLTQEAYEAEGEL